MLLNDRSFFFEWQRIHTEKAILWWIKFKYTNKTKEIYFSFHNDRKNNQINKRKDEKLYEMVFVCVWLVLQILNMNRFDCKTYCWEYKNVHIKYMIIGYLKYRITISEWRLNSNIQYLLWTVSSECELINEKFHRFVIDEHE